MSELKKKTIPDRQMIKARTFNPLTLGGRKFNPLLLGGSGVLNTPLVVTLLIIRVGAATPLASTEHEKRIGLLEEKVHRLERTLSVLLSAVSNHIF